MRYFALIAMAAGMLAAGCTVATRERVVERPTAERTVVYSDPAPATTTTVYTR
jgi:hypothetical protein